MQAKMQEMPVTPGAENSALQAELDDLTGQLKQHKEEHEAVVIQLTTARNEQASTQRMLDDKQTKLDSLAQSNASLASQVTTLQDANRENDAKVRDLGAMVEEKEALVLTLKEAVDAKTSKEGEAAAAIKAKDVEIGLLETRIKRAIAEFDDERKELLGHVDELRKAGQVSVMICLQG